MTWAAKARIAVPLVALLFGAVVTARDGGLKLASDPKARLGPTQEEPARQWIDAILDEDHEAILRLVAPEVRDRVASDLGEPSTALSMRLFSGPNAPLQIFRRSNPRVAFWPVTRFGDSGEGGFACYYTKKEPKWPETTDALVSLGATERAACFFMVRCRSEQNWSFDVLFSHEVDPAHANHSYFPAIEAACGAGDKETQGVDPTDPTSDIALPVLRRRAAPTFPSKALRERLPGLVVMIAYILPTGDVDNVSIARSTNPIFNDAALAAVKRWKYEPARQGGRPVAHYLSVRVDFNLKL